MNTPLKFNKLVISIQIALLASVNAYAEDNEPYAELETINITAQTESYLESEASSATGLNLEAVKTPQSTTVITEEFIEDKDIKNVAELVQETPGVALQKVDGGKSAYYARGFEIDNYQVDGMNVQREAGWSTGDHLASTAVFEKVEVVRGATGLMTGSGTPSASINLLRKRADSDFFTGRVTANYDQYGGYNATLDAGGGLIPNGKLRGRLVADYKDGETYIDRQEQESQTLYGVIDADITDSTTISIGVKEFETNQRATMWGSLPAYYNDGSKIDYDVSFNPSPDWANWNTDGTEYFATIKQNITDNIEFTLNGAHSEIEKDSKLFFITTIPGLGVNPNPILGSLDSGVFGIPARYFSNHESDTVKGNITANFDAFGQQHQFVLGGSYEKYSREADIYSDYTPFKFLTFVDFKNWDGSVFPEPNWLKESTDTQTQNVKETGVFAATQLQILDPLSLILGTRISNYKRENKTKKGTDNLEVKAEVTPYLGITYEIADNKFVYASYTDIFQPQKERDANAKVLDPIIGEGYEIGFKGTNIDNSLQAQIGLFYTKQDNLAQATGRFIEGQIPPEPTYIGADGAVSQGIDAEITGMINPNWQASIGYTYFDAKDRNDKTINPYVPHEILKIATTYDVGGGLTVGGGLNYNGEKYALYDKPNGNIFVTSPKEKYIQDPVLLANLMARYELDNNLAFQLNVNNVFDEKYVSGLGAGQIYYGEPRTVTGKISYEW